MVRLRAARPGVEPLPPHERTTWQGGLIAGWCGMRGIVTVATALALPRDFPQRDVILFTAFAVTLGTLLIQGLTLRPLVVALDVGEDDPVEAEVRTARAALAEAALDALEGRDDEDAVSLRGVFEKERRAASDADSGDGRARLSGKALRAAGC